MGNLLITYKSVYLFRQFLMIILLVGSRFCLATPKSTAANFVFGDSLVDVGNNNYIVSLSKADFVPNGIDFGRPTGRYSNGRTIVDIIGKFFTNINSFCFSFLSIN